MQLITERFGPVEIDPAEIWEVPEGIPGFPALRRVVLLGAGTVPGQAVPEEQHSMFWLQDVDHPATAFLCIQPWTVFPDYDFEFDAVSLGIEHPDDVSVLTLVTVVRGEGAMTMTTNLRAPLVVDTERRQMHQVILTDQRWAVREPFATTRDGELGSSGEAV